jgi:hypothetical protein
MRSTEFDGMPSEQLLPCAVAALAELGAAGAVPGIQLGHAGHWPYRAARVLGVDRASWTLPAPYAHWLERYQAA